MTSSLPETVSILNLCQNSRTLSGRLMVVDCLRLVEALPLPAEIHELDVKLKFWLDGAGYSRFSGEVTGRLPLVCQRCLSGYDFEFSSQIASAYFESEDALEEAMRAGNLPDDVEAVVIEPAVQIEAQGDTASVEEEKLINFVALIEDDLLLALPMVPLHPEKSDGSPGCKAAKVADTTEDAKPNALAAGLAAIRKDLKKDLKTD